MLFFLAEKNKLASGMAFQTPIVSVCAVAFLNVCTRFQLRQGMWVTLPFLENISPNATALQLEVTAAADVFFFFF